MTVTAGRVGLAPRTMSAPVPALVGVLPRPPGRWPEIAAVEAFHVGTLDPARVGCHGPTLEGEALSVSPCPDAWEHIARLGGEPWWRLTPPPGGGRFLDGIACRRPRRLAALARWGTACGLVVPARQWRLSWWDADDELRRTAVYADEGDARAELGFLRDDADAAGCPRPTLTPVAAYAPTAALADLVGRTRPDPALCDDDLAVAASAALGLDGVWWDEYLDPGRLSAPRAAIHRWAAGRWQAEPVEPW